MAQQEQTFNLNTVTYEGAGKVYEVLADNAGQKARVAGQEKTQALGQHNQASSVASSFRNAAQATKNQAIGVANKATKLMTDSANRLSAAERARVASEERTSITISNALAKAGNHYLAAEVTAQALEGTMNGMKTQADLTNMIATDPDEVIREVEYSLMKLEQDPDNPYLKNYVKQIMPTYAPARAEKETNRVNTVLMGYTAHVEENDGRVSSTDMKGWAEANDVNLGWVKDADYKINANRYMYQLEKAPNDIEAVGVLHKEWEDLKAERYDNNHWLKSKSDATKGLITEADSAYNKALKAKLGAIKTASADMFVEVMRNPDRYIPSQVEKIVQGMQLEPEAAESHKLKYADAFVEQGNWKGYLLNNPDPRGKEDMSTQLPEGKEGDYEQMISDKLMDYLNRGDLDSLGAIMQNRSNYVGGFAKDFNQLYNSMDAEGKAVLGSKLASMVDTDVLGRTHLSNLLTPKRLTEILTLNSISMAFGGDYDAAYKIYNDSATLGKPLDNPVYNTAIKKAGNYSKTLSQAGSRHVSEFEEAARRIARALPSEADDIIENMFNVYDSLTSKEGQSGVGIKWGGITVDRTYASESYRTEVDDIGRDEIRQNMIKVSDSLGVNATRITFVPGGKARLEDPIMGTSVVFDYQPLVKQYKRDQLVTTSLTTEYDTNKPKLLRRGNMVDRAGSKEATNMYNKKFVTNMRKKVDGEGNRMYSDLEIYKFMDKTVGVENITDTRNADEMDEVTDSFLDMVRSGR